MPTTRRGSETPGRDALQKQQKGGQRDTSHSKRTEVPLGKSSDKAKTGHIIEGVRSTRRSQTVTLTGASSPRRTRTAVEEPVKPNEAASGQKLRRDVEKSKNVKQKESVLRSSKRTAESPREVAVKKQKTFSAISSPKPMETSEENTGTQNKKVTKSEIKSETENSNDKEENAKAGQANMKKGSETVKTKTGRGQRLTRVSDVADSVSTDLISPRRSSRAVVPNSRYKDMVDPGKRMSVKKMEVKKEVHSPPPRKPKFDFISLSVPQQGDLDEITEEIITEETKIDTLAQMNLMDDMLVLPTSSTRSETESAFPKPDTISISSVSTNMVKHQTTEVMEHQFDSHDPSNLGSEFSVETKVEINNEAFKVMSGDVSSVEETRKTKSARKPDYILPDEIIPEPQVIMISSDTGINVSKIIIPKDPYRARLEQAFEEKGIARMIGPGYAQPNQKRIIVTPTHHQVSKKEGQKAEFKKSKFIDSPLIYSEKPEEIRASSVTHTSEKVSEKKMKYTVLPRKESKCSLTSMTEVNLHCNEEDTGASHSEVDQRGSASVTSAIKTSTVPQVKIVYVKAKQNPDMSDSKFQANKKSFLSVNEGSGDKSDEIKTNKPINKVEDTSIDNSEHFKANEIELENADIGISGITGQTVGTAEESSTEELKETKAVNQVEMTSVGQVASSLCQVIEYKKPQTAIEYVLLDNKMVPIHKPYTVGLHGRQTGRQVQQVNRATPGRVEPGSLKEHGVVKKIPLSTAQTAISTVISQIGDQQTSLTPAVNQHVKYTISSGQLEIANVTESQEIKTEPLSPRVIHGYIDHPVRSGSPTQIVEISTEAFNKEIYGEEIPLHTVTGHIVEASSTETSHSESIPAQTVPQQMSETENQSMEDVSYQPIETEVSQPTESTAVDQSSLENTEKGKTMVYTENEDGGHVEEISSWAVDTPVLPSGTEILMTPSSGKGPVSDRDGLVHIEGLDHTQIPENATITIEKLASGGEIVIMQIKETAVSETLEKIKTSASDVINSSPEVAVSKTPVTVKEARVIQKPVPQFKKKGTSMKILPVQKLTEVKITPVRAYERSETQSSDKGESSNEVPSKTTGTNTDNSDVEFTEMEEEEEEGVRFEDSSTDQGNPYQEYIVVRLPEGAEVKQLHARPKRENKPLGEEVTVNDKGHYVCVDCGHTTENRGNWFKHRRKHLGIRPHACTRCSYRAATSSNLKRHMLIHDDVRNFQCAYCNTLFRQKIHLERHLKYKHEEKNVQCPLCEYVCSSENPDLKIHIKRRHMPHEGALNAFTCDVCGLMTVSKKDLKQHKKFHKNGPELKLFCEHCSFVTDCVSRLRRHMLIHTKERPFQCGLCMYRATQKEHVLRHMRSQHGVEVERNQRRSLLEKNYHSPQEILIAGMDQSSTSSIKEASSEADLGPFEKSDYSSTDKIFACNYCSMKFAKLINLYKHLYAQHKQVMPDEGPNDFQCVVCDFRTNNKKNLLVHMRKHNMQDHSPPTHVYSCVLCRYINPRRRNLFQHMKKKHGIEIIMKDDGLNCYVTLENAAAQVHGQNVKSSVMALSDIVTTQTMDDATQNLLIAESSNDSSTFQAEKISIDNIIPDDMESYVVTDTSQEHSVASPQVSVSTVLHSSVQEHEAAEAIEGLQALAEQAGILETQNIDNDMTTEIVSSAIEIASTEIMNDGEVMNNGENVISETAEEEQSGQTTDGFELSSEQLNQLATGDYVEINGEVYKVEIAPESS